MAAYPEVCPPVCTDGTYRERQLFWNEPIAGTAQSTDQPGRLP